MNFHKKEINQIECVKFGNHLDGYLQTLAKMFKKRSNTTT